MVFVITDWDDAGSERVLWATDNQDKAVSFRDVYNMNRPGMPAVIAVYDALLPGVRIPAATVFDN
jgi:hypothetical protein